jgi:hypothetical protein
MVTGSPNVEGWGDVKSKTALAVCAPRNRGKAVKMRTSPEKAGHRRHEVNIYVCQEWMATFWQVILRG